MADSSVTTVLSACATVNSKMSDLPLKDGQLIFIQDKQTIALDFVVETAVLWTYQNGWVQITTSPKEISNIEKAAKDYADEVSNLMTGTLDEDGNVIITLDERIFKI